MSQDDWFESWKRSRAEPHVPGDFADRVMVAVREQAASSRRQSLVRLVLARALASPRGRFAVCCLAAAACMLRIASLFAFLVIR